jgi:hypothetical protein
VSGRDNDLRQLRAALAEGQDVIAVHYACEAFPDARDHPAAISCIAVASVKDENSIAFSLADEPTEMPLLERERKLLERWWQYLADRRDAKVVHWNMNSSTFGFDALALRYRFLTGQDPSYRPPDHLLFDLDTIIGRLFGEVYVRHPKLYSLAVLNGLGIRSFLRGADEARRYKDSDFGAIRDSVSTKSRIIATLLQRLASGHLLTQNSVGLLEFAGEQLDAVATVMRLGDRFLYVKRSLTRRRSNRPTLEVSDEYDAQDLFRSLLYVFFDDIRPEEWTPSYAAGSSRIDFLLPDFRVAIELKHSRTSMSAKDLAEELIVDRDRYSVHPGISHLICLVFDYAGLLDGPRAIERDLARDSSTEGLAVTVRIYDR